MSSQPMGPPVPPPSLESQASDLQASQNAPDVPPPQTPAGPAPPGALANAPTSNPVLEKRQSAMGRMFHGTLAALEGKTVSYQRDPNSGKMVVTEGKKTPGQWARGLLAGAFTGMAAGAANPGRPGARALSGVGAGFEAVQEQAGRADASARHQADEDFEVQQKAKMQQAQTALLNQNLAEKTWDLRNKQVNSAWQLSDRENELAQRIAEDPNNKDLGTAKDFDSLVQMHKTDAPDLLQKHVQGLVVSTPAIDSDGHLAGMHFAIVSPDWKSQKIEQDMQIPQLVPGSKPGEHPSIENQTVKAGTMTKMEYEQTRMAHVTQIMQWEENKSKIDAENVREQWRIEGEKEKARIEGSYRLAAENVKEKLSKMDDPVYAFDTKTKRTILTTRGEAIKGGMTVPRKVSETQVSKDASLASQLGDVQTKIEEYRNTFDVNDTPLTKSELYTIGALQDEMNADSLHGIPLPSSASGFSAMIKAKNLDNLSARAMKRVIAYSNAIESLVGYKTVLSGSSRASDKSMELAAKTLPPPGAPADFGISSIDAFRQNLHVLNQRVPVLPGIRDPQEIESDFEKTRKDSEQAAGIAKNLQIKSMQDHPEKWKQLGGSDLQRLGTFTSTNLGNGFYAIYGQNGDPIGLLPDSLLSLLK